MSITSLGSLSLNRIQATSKYCFQPSACHLGVHTFWYILLYLLQWTEKWQTELRGLLLLLLYCIQPPFPPPRTPGQYCSTKANAHDTMVGKLPEWLVSPFTKDKLNIVCSMSFWDVHVMTSRGFAYKWQYKYMYL